MIKDSGKRREFSTGAVRDIQEGNGRCDLLPLDICGDYLECVELVRISEFVETMDEGLLYEALDAFKERTQKWKTSYGMILEVAKHFEEGAKKYGENNWQKGLPLNCYIDSAVRHFLKYCDGWDDEPHDRAFVWNILCGIWTMKNRPEMNNLKGEQLNEG